MVVVGLPHDVAHLFYCCQGGLVEYQRGQWPFWSFSDVAFEEIQVCASLFCRLTFPFLVVTGHGAPVLGPGLEGSTGGVIHGAGVVGDASVQGVA